MQVELSLNQSKFRHLPIQQIHWDSLLECHGPQFFTKVYGIERRDDQILLLLIPDKRLPEDVFFSNVVQYELVDCSIPEDWNVPHEVVSQVLCGKGPNYQLIGYHIFRSTEDFIWRLSEGKLTRGERASLEKVLN